MAGGLAGEQLERGVVIDVDAGGRFGQHAAVAMIGVLAKADVGDDQNVGGAFGRLDRALDDSLIAIGIAAQRNLWRRERRTESRPPAPDPAAA